MKKIFTALTALSIFCMAATSCSSIEKTKKSENLNDSSVLTDETSEPADSEQLLLINSFKYEEIPMPDGVTSVWDIDPIKDTGEFIVQFADENYNPVYYKTNSSFSQFTPLDFEIPSELEAYDSCHFNLNFNNDGSFFAFVITEDHGGLKAPDVFDENFDYESYNNNCISSYTLCKYDKNCAFISQTPINYPEEYIDEYGYLSLYDSAANGDTFIQSVSSENAIVSLGADGNPEKHFIEETDPDKTDIHYLFLRDGEGKIVIFESYSVTRNDSQGMVYYESAMNLRTLNDDYTLGEPFFSLVQNGVEMMSSPTPGTGDYKLYMSMIDGLFGIKEDGSMTQVINWSDSGVEAMKTYCVGEDEYIGLRQEENGFETLIRLTPRDPSEFANKKVITMANINNYYPTAEINNFNNSQSSYHVQTINYTSSDDYDQNLKQLDLDLISDNAPDIIFDPPYSSYLNYQKKGVFADIYQFMDNDNELNRDTIMPNVLKATESSDGKLYSLCARFELNTLATKTRIFDKENWTFDEMLDLYENAPPEAIHIYDGETKSDMFRTMFFTMNDLINYDNATCDFNNQQVVQMLEFCNRFVNEVDMPDKFSDPEGHQGYYTDKYTWLKNDQIIVTPISLSNLTSFDLVKYMEGGGEDLTFVGYPSNDGKGGRITTTDIMSINESCENKQGAWEFIKHYIKKNNDRDFGNGYEGGLPVLKDSLNKALDAEMTAEHTAGGQPIPSLTQADRDMIFNYILQCDSIGTVLDYDLTLLCEEEADIYFAGGQTAEETAEHIQNRASILISEKS